ncbi:MAG: Glycosyl transferase group 1, partial [Berkelbacteria bacterium GW2011_GWA2_38_9]
RLTKEKGIEYLIKSAKKIKAEIFIIGGGVEKRRLMDYARKTEATNIHFLGYFGKEYIEELREFYRKADVLVLPSVVDESLGLVLLEAMACETPVVASNKGGIPLAVKDKVNGYLIRAKSSKQITEKVNWLLNNPEKSAVMGKNARQLIQEKFSWQSISPKIVKIYETTNNESQTLRKKYQILDQTDIEKQEIELNKKIGYVS